MAWKKSTSSLRRTRFILGITLRGNTTIASQPNGQKSDGKPSPLRAGREYLHGLTKEKDADAGGLHPNQVDPAQAWAIGFYNERAGYTLGRVFRTPSGYPDPSQANFPPQSVAFKLLFTDATEDQVPYLKGS